MIPVLINTNKNFIIAGNGQSTIKLGIIMVNELSKTNRMHQKYSAF